MDSQIIRVCKTYAETNNLEMLQEYYVYLMSGDNLDHTPDWPFIFQKVYLHACLKGSSQIADWLRLSIFPTLDPIQQIGLRQIFPYGRYLLSRKKSNQPLQP